MSENDSQENSTNDESEESKHESSESDHPETSFQEKVEHTKVEETTSDDTNNAFTQKNRGTEDTPVHIVHLQENTHNEEVEENKDGTEKAKEEVEKDKQEDVATEKVQEEPEKKETEKVQKEEVEKDKDGTENTQKEEAEENKNGTEKVHKEEAEKDKQEDVATEKVQEELEKKETHQDNQPNTKQEKKEIRDKEKKGKKESSKEVKESKDKEKKGKKGSSTIQISSPSPEKGKPRPKRLLEERQPMTARYSGVMNTARDSKEVPVTSREVTREERSEKELAGWEITQKKAFTHWINSYLMSRNLKIEELGNDFRSGVLLIRFLECLTGQPFEQKYHTNPKLRVHSLENSQLSLKYLRNIKVPDITIGPEEIVDGNIKMMLGFCWILLRHFGKQQMQRDSGDGDKNDNTSFEDSILKWVRDQIKDYNIDVSSFKTSFNDGRAFLALCHKFNPSCIDYENTDLSNSHTNVENGLRLIEQQYNVPALLHVDDLTAGKESDKNIVLYLSLLHGAWRRETEKKKVTEVTEERVFTLQEKLTILEEESRALKEERTELEEKVETLKKKLVEESEEKVELKDTKEQESQRITSEKEELKKAKDKLDKEKSELANENEQILQRLRRQQRAKEELEEAVKKEQAKFSIAMEFLRKNIIEHLREIDEWKEFLEKGRNFKKEPVNLLKEDDLKNKSTEAQIEALNKVIMEENKRIELLLEEREKEKKSPRSPRNHPSTSSSPQKTKPGHQRVGSTSVRNSERKSETKKKT